jgi:FKBP-type peptidyl-prolyl cis-trans isomerase
MGEGDSATVYETIDTFLQKFVPPALKDAKEVRHELVLVDVITKAEKEKSQAEADAKFLAVQNKTQSKPCKSYAAGTLAGLTTTGSGLKVKIEDQGSGAQNQGRRSGESTLLRLPHQRYTMFDNSYQRGEMYPYPAGVGQMIPGFDEGVMLLNRGGKILHVHPLQTRLRRTGLPARFRPIRNWCSLKLRYN